MSESYVSLLLGVLVVGVVLFGLVSFAKNRQPNLPKAEETVSQPQAEDISQAPLAEPSEMPPSSKLPTTHVVKSGESLWTISERYYGTGYNWTAIEKANNLKDNPGVIYKDTKLVIPRVENNRIMAIDPQAAKTEVPSSISKNTYTIAKDDTLWEIAVRSYGDGYRWVDIAKANNLTNPGLIHSGNTLQIPR